MTSRWRLWLVLMMLAAALAGAYRKGVHDGASTYELQLSRLRERTALELARAQQTARAQERRWQSGMEALRLDARAQIDKAAADAAVANHLAVGLREQARRLAVRASAGCAAPLAAGSAPAAGAAMVLADVLARCDARAGELAAAYDRAALAGALCERAYDEIEKPASL